MDIRAHHGVQGSRQQGRGARRKKALFLMCIDLDGCSRAVDVRLELPAGNLKFNKGCRPVMLTSLDDSALPSCAGSHSCSHSACDRTKRCHQAMVVARCGAFGDDLQGRDSGSEGYKRAAQYVVTEFERAGLKPAGETAYYQSVGCISPPASGRIKRNAGSRQYGCSVALASSTHHSHAGRHARSHRCSSIFAGNSPKPDNFAVQGKLVVSLNGFGPAFPICRFTRGDFHRQSQSIGAAALAAAVCSDDAIGRNSGSESRTACPALQPRGCRTPVRRLGTFV